LLHFKKNEIRLNKNNKYMNQIEYKTSHISINNKIEMKQKYKEKKKKTKTSNK